ncbi:hypothetical protein LguiA_017819 [Lonicera macranthoides]
MASFSTTPRSKKRQGHLSKPTAKSVSGEGYGGFRNKGEQEWWSMYFDLKPVVIERPAKIQSFDVFPHRAAFEERPGWIDYFGKSSQVCNASICTEFIASLIQDNANDEYSFTARVRNKWVKMNLRTVSTTLKIPALGKNEFALPLREDDNGLSHDELASFLRGRESSWNQPRFPKSEIHQDHYALWLVVANAITPTSHTATLTPSQAQVVEAIARRRKFCLVRHFIRQIAEAINSTTLNEGIKMGVLITNLCLAHRVVERAEDDTRLQLHPLDRTTMNRSMGQFRYRGRGLQTNEGDDAEGADTMERGEESDQEREEGEPHQEETSSQVRRGKRRGTEGPVPLDMDAIMQRFDQMSTMVTDGFQSLRDEQQAIRDSQACLEEQQAHIRAEMNEGFAHMRGEFDYWRHYFPPPPDI